MGTIVAIVADTHIGGATSLALHEWTYETGDYESGSGEPIEMHFQATKAQDWIYEKWQEFWRHVWTLKTEGNHYLKVIHLGDIVEGLHHNSVQALQILSAQVGMAIEILRPIADMADGGMYILRGTESHAGQVAQAEASIAKELGVKICAWELILDIDGMLIDCAHHGRSGVRSWASTAASMAVEAQVDAAQEGRPLPRYVFRAHRHVVDDSGERVAQTRAMVVPSWQLRTAYGYKVAAGRRSDIGGVIILPDGSLDLSCLRYYAAPGQRKVLSE